MSWESLFNIERLASWRSLKVLVTWNGVIVMMVVVYGMMVVMLLGCSYSGGVLVVAMLLGWLCYWGCTYGGVVMLLGV